MTESEIQSKIENDINELDLLDEGDVNILYAVKHLLEKHGFTYNDNDIIKDENEDDDDNEEYDEDEDEDYESDYEDGEDEKYDNIYATNTNDIAEAEYQRHLYEQLTKKSNNGNKPQQGL